MKLICITALYAAGIFLLQRILFLKTSKTIFHCFPLYIIYFVYLATAGCFLYDTLGFSSHDGFLFRSLMAWIIIGINTAALLADGIAWLIEKIRKQKNTVSFLKRCTLSCSIGESNSGHHD